MNTSDFSCSSIALLDCRRAATSVSWHGLEEDFEPLHKALWGQAEAVRRVKDNRMKIHENSLNTSDSMQQRIIKHSMHTWCVRARGRSWVPAFARGEADSHQRRARSVASPHLFCAQQTYCSLGRGLKAAPWTEAACEDSRRPGSQRFNKQTLTTTGQLCSSWELIISLSVNR